MCYVEQIGRNEVGEILSMSQVIPMSKSDRISIFICIPIKAQLEKEKISDY